MAHTSPFLPSNFSEQQKHIFPSACQSLDLSDSSVVFCGDAGQDFALCPVANLSACRMAVKM